MVRADALPSFTRAAADVGEDLLVEHRLDAVVDGPAPPGLRRALSVKAGWPLGPLSPSEGGERSPPTQTGRPNAEMDGHQAVIGKCRLSCSTSAAGR